jgi:hypothetical protein
MWKGPVLRLLRAAVHVVLLVIGAIGAASSASAQVVDATIFGGLAFPLYDERIGVRNPSIPGIEITVAGSPEIRADGGAVFGGVVGVSSGRFGIEGRLDATQVGLDFSGARYDLRGTSFPFQGLTASIILAPGRFDADRIPLLSLNGRFTTLDRVALIASGGLSYLTDITVGGTVPVAVDEPGVPGLTEFDASLQLRASPGQSGHRFGVNGGAGVRIGGRVALMAEVRGFYFGEYDLRFSSEEGDSLLDDLLGQAATVSFRPVFVNAQVGVTFRF